MIGTPRKPGTPTLKPSTSLGTKSTSRTLSSSTAKPAAPRAAAAKTSLGKTATGIVDRAASAAKSARIYGGGAGSTPTRTTPVRTTTTRTTTTSKPGPSFGNVRSGVSTTAPARKAVFGNVVGGVISSAASAPRALPSTYTVLQGDSLSKIAKRLYGKSSAWRKLFEANRDQIDDADLIHPGQVLRVPEL